MTWDKTKGRPEPIRLLNRIAERDNREPLVHVSQYAPSLRLIRPQVIPYVRKTVAEMVERAAGLLPAGMHLGLVEGWRPFERQKRIYEFMWENARAAYPDRNHAALRRTVCRWVAPIDQKAPPGHCTGAAVDVWLVNDHDEPIDVSSPFERFEAAATYSYGLAEEAHRNRTTLVEAMLAVGFSNCRDEWWHYSYGDAGWAVRLGYDHCVYGLAEMDPSLYEDLERRHAESMKDRPNPFLHRR